MRDSNLKGAIAEQTIMLEATRLGVRVWLPAAEHGRADMVFEVVGRLWKVQCKWGRLTSERDVVIVPLCSHRRGPDGYIRRGYAEEEVDLIAVYCEELNRCFQPLLSSACVAHGWDDIHLSALDPSQKRTDGMY